MFRGGSHADAVKAFREFLRQYPDSVHAPNANYWLGNAQFALKDYKSALDIYRGLLEAFPHTQKAADTYFNMAGCLLELAQKAEAKKILEQLIAKYPGSEAAARAKKQLAATK